MTWTGRKVRRGGWLATGNFRPKSPAISWPAAAVTAAEKCDTGSADRKNRQWLSAAGSAASLLLVWMSARCQPCSRLRQEIRQLVGAERLQQRCSAAENITPLVAPGAEATRLRFASCSRVPEVVKQHRRGRSDFSTGCSLCGLSGRHATAQIVPAAESAGAGADPTEGNETRAA